MTDLIAPPPDTSPTDDAIVATYIPPRIPPGVDRLYVMIDRTEARALQVATDMPRDTDFTQIARAVNALVQMQTLIAKRRVEEAERLEREEGAANTNIHTMKPFDAESLRKLHGDSRTLRAIEGANDNGGAPEGGDADDPGQVAGPVAAGETGPRTEVGDISVAAPGSASPTRGRDALDFEAAKRAVSGVEAVEDIRVPGLEPGAREARCEVEGVSRLGLLTSEAPAQGRGSGEGQNRESGSGQARESGRMKGIGLSPILPIPRGVTDD